MIFIGTLRERFASWPFVDCFNLATAHLRQAGINHYMMGIRATNIFKGRKALVEQFLKTDAEMIIFIDSDETFAPATFECLYKMDLPVVSGLVFMKINNHPPCIYRRIPGTDFNHSMAQEVKDWMDENDIPRSNIPRILDLPAEGNVWEVDECGTGCLAIKREVFEKVPRPWFEGNGETGTDIMFCRRVREAGFPIHVDLRVQLGHLIEHQVGMADFAQVSKWAPLPIDSDEA
jgi:hypothetical protein